MRDRMFQVSPEGCGGISRFLRHWVEWPFSARWLTEHAVGQTMLNLNSSILGRLPVVLPSEDERTHIGAVLDTSI